MSLCKYTISRQISFLLVALLLKFSINNMLLIFSPLHLCSLFLYYFELFTFWSPTPPFFLGSLGEQKFKHPFRGASLASPGVILKECSSRIQFDNMYMKYSHFSPSLSLSVGFASHSKLQAASLWKHVSDIGRGSRGDVCVCAWHPGITQTSILLDSCSLPSDASHLRQRQQRPSKPSACLSLLIDLSLEWRCLGMLWGKYVFWQMLCMRMCTIHKKGRGLELKMLSAPRGKLVVFVMRWVV